MDALDSNQMGLAVSASPPANPRQRFISCCPEELVDVELEALRQGRERARADGARALRVMQEISNAACVACERALTEQYVALDVKTFRDVFTLAWCAGYHEESARLPQR